MGFYAYLLILRLGLLSYSCGAPLSAISMAIVIIHNSTGMFNIFPTFFKKKFAAVKKSVSGDQEIRG